jgi:lysophospholipase L1-like esterase
VAWDDGGTSSANYNGGADGASLADFTHTYADKPGTYTITQTGQTLAGSCGSLPTTLVFTLTATASARARLKLAALGDSYSAGNGTPQATGDCDRSPQAWPELVPGKVGGNAISSSVALLACSGADSTGSESGDLPAQIAQLRTIKPAPSLVTVTVGGDDGRSAGVGFRNVLIKCHLTVGTCAGATAAELSWIANDEPALLRQDYSAIKAADPSAVLLVVGYPQIFPDNTGCRGYSKAEMQLLSQLTGPLDAAIASAAAEVPSVEYVNTSSTFSGNLLCSSDPWVVPPLTINAQTGVHDWMHPNVDGQNAIANVAAEFIKTTNLTTG